MPPASADIGSVIHSDTARQRYIAVQVAKTQPNEVASCPRLRAAAVFLPATSGAFSGKPKGAIRPPGRHSACPGPLIAAIPDRLSRPTIMLSGFAPGSRIVRHFGGDS